MALSTFPPIPYDAAFLEGDDKPISEDWYHWLFALVQLLQAAARVASTKSLINQGAAVAATPFAVTGAGVYRVSWTLRITQPASSSSSATVTIGYSDQLVAILVAAPAVTGNTTTTVQSGSVMLRSDAASPVTLAVAYASVGGVPMLFKIDAIAEQVST